MSDEARELIEELARRCARKGLSLRDAQVLFGELYRADALAIAGGNVTRAAEIAGVDAAAFHRARRKKEKIQGSGRELDKT